MAETWYVSFLPTVPVETRSYNVTSIYYSAASDIEENPQLRERTYEFKGAESWEEVALHALKRAGRRPDCTVQQEIDIQKSLPFRYENDRLIVGARSQIGAFL